MTTSATKTNTLQIRSWFLGVTAVVAVLAAIALGQWLASGTPVTDTDSATNANSAQATPSAGSTRLVDALAEGKFDTDPVSAPSNPRRGGVARPEPVVVLGSGALYDGFIAGKFDTDFGTPDRSVNVVGAGAAWIGGGSLADALAAGWLEGGLITVGTTDTPTAPVPSEPTVSGGHQE